MDRASPLQKRRKAQTAHDCLVAALYYRELREAEENAIIRHRLGLVEASYRLLAKSTELLMRSKVMVESGAASRALRLNGNRPRGK
jgi:hypothetical protein